MSDFTVPFDPFVELVCVVGPDGSPAVGSKPTAPITVSTNGQVRRLLFVNEDGVPVPPPGASIDGLGTAATHAASDFDPAGSAAAVAASIPITPLTTGLVTRFSFTETSGRAVKNSARPTGAPVNLFPAPEALGYNDTKVTPRYGPPLNGSGSSSRWNQSGYSSLGRAIPLDAGTYTLGVLVSALPGAPTGQKVAQQFNNVTLADVVVPTFPQVALLQMTQTVGAAGTIGVNPLFTSSTNAANDLIFSGVQLVRGTSLPDYIPNTGDGSINGTYTRTSTGVTASNGVLASISGTLFSEITVYAVMTWPTATASPDPLNAVLAGGYLPGAAESFYLQAAAGFTDGAVHPGFNFSGVGILTDAANVHDGNPHMVTGVYTVGDDTLRVFVDDLELGVRAAAGCQPVLAALLAVGALNETGQVFPGEVENFGLHNVGFTAAQVRAQFSALRSTLAGKLTLTQPDFVAIGGDSTSVNFPWAQNAINNQTPVVQGRNYGIGGSVITAAMGTALNLASLEVQLASMAQNVSPTRRKNVFGGLCGYNALNAGGQSGAQAFADMKALYLIARSLGANRQIAFTLLPNASATIQTQIDAYNALVRGDASWYTQLCDFAADPNIGTHAAALDTTKYSDGTHETASTAAVMTTIFTPVLAAALV